MRSLDWTPGKTGFLEIGEASLEYSVFGPPPTDAPTIVMLHEGLGSVSTWKDFPKRIAEETGCGVFVFSRSGYGQSSPCELPRPLDYMSREAMEVVPEVLNQVGGDKYVLLGHSDGASIAAIYAGSVEDFRVRGLILMAPHFFTEPQGLASIEKARAVYEESDLREKLSRHHENVDNAFRGWNDAWLDPDFESWDITEVIDYWRIPALGIQGEQDEYGSLAQIKIMSDRSYAPVDEAIIPDCGHAPHRDQPERTLSAIKEFVSRLARLENERVEIA